MRSPRHISEAQFARLTEPRLLLFMSVDMENSTRLKQRMIGRNDHKWLGVVMQFLDEFPRLLRSQQERIDREHHLSDLPAPELWKVLGDEMVFKAELTESRQVNCLVEAFRAALIEANDRYRQSHLAEDDDTIERLPLKGTAWIAGFPVANSIIPLDGREDYLGPSMDAGFRIAKLASSQRLVISVDLAWLLIVCRSPSLRFHYDIHFDGRSEMKGLAEGVGYPVFWIEVQASKYQDHEDKLLGRSYGESHDQLRNLCAAFIQEHGTPSELPFIPKAPQTTPRPESYEADRRLKIELLRQLLEVGEEPNQSEVPADEVELKAEELLNDLNIAHGPEE